jgi:hypothetical protein
MPVRTLGLSAEELAALAEQVSGAGGRLEVRARGHSMWPVIADGERVRLGPLPAGGPWPGDILLARLEDGLVLHRYLGQVPGPDGPWLLLGGDAELGPPARVPAGQALARVERIRRGLGPFARPGRGLRLLAGWLLALPGPRRPRRA